MRNWNRSTEEGRKVGRSERASAQESQKIGKGFGSGRSEDWKGLRFRKIGRLEGASAQESRKIRQSFGSGRSKRLEGASATENRRTGRRELEGPRGGKGASPGSRRESRRKPAEPKGRETSIKKGGSRRPATGGQKQRPVNRTKLGRPRRYCSTPLVEFRNFYRRGGESLLSFFYAWKILGA